ncbi:C-methyltransferase-like protein [Haloactinopolyspora alba]|uniref:C-methyltransferase-like protein n=1 Tax=Haloactinopolyspora alba TaxID=648780 RepID=A0A2P8E5K0_9ACTN|nr:class I SAM-dependent methyltransferase [Haloactinopolyspora alba]PSL04742.1 C-methyltransferase-like protein [Haloactinopolyspora alba]
MNVFSCPACDGFALEDFHTVEHVPANSCLMLDDPVSARAFPTGDVRLAVCLDCGFVTNTAFEPSLTTYGTDYEESQACSALFRDYITDLSATWVERYGLAGGTVVEIGCGKGDFLATMVRAGAGHGIGIDPALRPDRVEAGVRDRTSWITGTFPEDYPRLDADGVVCRHTLEHIGDVGTWLGTVRAAIGERTDSVVLFEVPDALRVLREGAFWDVYYEHCSYFSAGSLERLFRHCGFDPVGVRTTYDDQYLVVEARPAARTPPRPDMPPDRDDVLAATRRFAARMDEARAHWRGRIRKVAESGGTTVVWGASSKAVAFLAVLGKDSEHVAAAVDINPHKQGRYLAGSGHRVVAPDELPTIDPDLVVAMNPTYLTEIGHDLGTLRLSATLEAL